MKTILIDKKAAAATLSISVRSIERLIADGKLPVVRVGGLVRIPIAALRDIARGATARAGRE